MALSLKENIAVGFTDFWSRKLRSFVTIFGIILGTMSIIVVLSLVNGMNKQTLEWMLQRGGFTKITIRKNWNYENEKHLKETLSLEEIMLIKNRVKEIKYFSPEKTDYTKFHYRDKEDYFALKGVMPDFSNIEEWNVQKGRFITEFDIKNKTSVMVIGTKIKEDLFGNIDPIGKYISVGNAKFKVVGIMEKKYLENKNSNNHYNMLEYMNKRAFIPLTTYLSKISNENEFSKFTVKTTDIKTAEIATKKIREILLNLRAGEEVFRVFSMEENKKEYEKNSAIFRMIFYIISVISLLVGGIVIMNILLSTIKERTREIGVRIAVGAKRTDIFMQFLIQTVLITFIGGLTGVLLALASLKKIAQFMNFELVPSVSTVVVALVVSVGVGLIFGILPSIKASKLNPVDALRYE